MSAQLISMADFNAAAKTGPVPVQVKVVWSESLMFDSGSMYAFKDFERIAHKVALDNAGGGYYKTKINVIFSNGQEYECRIDLAANDEPGFTDHCQKMLNYWRREGCNGYDKDLFDFLSSVDFSGAYVDKGAAKQKAEADFDAEVAAKQKAEADFDAEVARLRSDSSLDYLQQDPTGTTETVKNIRKFLVRTFPGVKMSVRKDGYNCCQICYENGPESRKVEEALSGFKAGYFDGMADCYEYSESPWGCVFGDLQYIFATRTISKPKIKTSDTEITISTDSRSKSYPAKIGLAEACQRFDPYYFGSN